MQPTDGGRVKKDRRKGKGRMPSRSASGQTGTNRDAKSPAVAIENPPQVPGPTVGATSPDATDPRPNSTPSGAKGPDPRLLSARPSGIVLYALLYPWHRFGPLPGTALTVAAFLVLLAMLWGLWKMGKSWSVVRDVPVLGSLYEQPIPKADKMRFSIAVAHFEGDSNAEVEAILIEELSALRSTVQTLTIDRRLVFHGGDNEEMERQGHARAKELLTESGADLLVWGRVLRESDRSAVKLVWTSRHRLTSELPAALRVPRDFRMPPMFRVDLSGVIAQVLVAEGSELSRANPSAVDADRTYIEKVQKVLRHAKLFPPLEEETGAIVRLMLGGARLRVAMIESDSNLMAQAEGDLAEALRNLGNLSATSPTLGSIAGESYGVALMMNGKSEHAVKVLADAKAKVSAADQKFLWRIEYSRALAVLQWAWDEHSPERADEAISALNVLREIHSSYPQAFDQSSVYQGLGQAYLLKATLGNGVDDVKKSVSLFDEAVAMRKTDPTQRDNLQKTQQSRSNALRLLAERLHE